MSTAFAFMAISAQANMVMQRSSLRDTADHPSRNSGVMPEAGNFWVVDHRDLRGVCQLEEPSRLTLATRLRGSLIFFVLTFFGCASQGSQVTNLSEDDPNHRAMVVHEIRLFTAIFVDYEGPRICSYPIERKLLCGNEGCACTEQHRPYLDPDTVVDLVIENAFPEWSAKGNSIQAMNGQLFVRASMETQERIANYLETLERDLQGN